MSSSDRSDWTSQLRRGVLELCILQVLRRTPSYGYEIVTTLADMGPLATTENTIYPLLRRLKTEQLLETFSKESPSGPPRQYYRITRAGMTHLATLEKEWGSMVDAVARCKREGETR